MNIDVFKSLSPRQQEIWKWREDVKRELVRLNENLITLVNSINEAAEAIKADPK
jgi:hypothetical protein